MWAQIFYINRVKTIGFCMTETREKFIFSLVQIPNAQHGDIIKFDVQPSFLVAPLKNFPDGTPQQQLPRAVHVTLSLIHI